MSGWVQARAADWTGLEFGDVWPYLVAGYGLFFVCFVLGFASVWVQWCRLTRRQRIFETLKSA